MGGKLQYKHIEFCNGIRRVFLLRIREDQTGSVRPFTF